MGMGAETGLRELDLIGMLRKGVCSVRCISCHCRLDGMRMLFSRAEEVGG